MDKTVLVRNPILLVGQRLAKVSKGRSWVTEVLLPACTSGSQSSQSQSFRDGRVNVMKISKQRTEPWLIRHGGLLVTHSIF